MIFRWFDFGKRETERNAGRNFWVKDPWLRLQDEISKFIFRSPSVWKNFEGSRMPFQHFEGIRTSKLLDFCYVRWLLGHTGIQYFEGLAVLVWNLTFQSFHRLLLRHWTFDT
ncbi:uncharacterized protein OCT59_019713 [Rhizophagus irregularis]|uniref:uncharacterized protein n=1 Tax=Rhizophagus irregularis TaxID=588596 RepID=UPI001A0696AC|nr:hypothetical protein OCT59_019713 [Rhizophagus irregularis]GET56236.1 hypothetical protein RIR_jg26492.t1 [Rhizophagus irregularis DAOM 181602=DAOM 197198]